MSLKYFHLVFLAFATLADAGFWAWTHFMPEDAANAGALQIGPYAGWLCLILLAYGFYYLTQKMRTIIV
ncbi:MAG: hypothetical protein IPK32_22355 [Verrucomicrobiaceae bacterium]|nr:hypothetical protein [Verrucomicrobiaceae bacterium]